MNNSPPPEFCFKILDHETNDLLSCFQFQSLCCGGRVFRFCYQALEISVIQSFNFVFSLCTDCRYRCWNQLLRTGPSTRRLATQSEQPLTPSYSGRAGKGMRELSLLQFFQALNSGRFQAIKYWEGAKFANNHYPLSWQDLPCPFLPATPLSLSRTLEGLLEQTRSPSRAWDLLCPLLLELQRNKGRVRCRAGLDTL